MPRNGWIARIRKERSRRWQLISSHLISHSCRQNVVSEQTNLISSKYKTTYNIKLTHTSHIIGPRFALNTVLRLAYVITLSQLFDRFMAFSQVCQACSTGMLRYVVWQSNNYSFIVLLTVKYQIELYIEGKNKKEWKFKLLSSAFDSRSRAAKVFVS